MKINTAQSTSMSLEDIYNLLMFDIERDLVTDRLYVLDQIYKDETEEQRNARLQRYADAWDIFEERFTKVMGSWSQALDAFKKKINKVEEEHSTTEQAPHLQQILSDIEHP